MKRFMQGVMAWKTSTCFLFTGSMVIYLVFCLVFGQEAVTTRQLWSLLLACVLGALIQGVCFSDWVIKKLRYTLRSMLFVALFLPALALTAWWADWFPAEEAGAWLVFIASFFVIFVTMSIGFDIYFRVTGRKYDGLLGQYRREKEERGE